ncbi:hypothetical protein C6P45_001797 [Maudiozyma exigua]|uniref:histone acetyltransferase n=1 Tax=Maudiozyma exigua TaxID=34358 RepID=A0A9P7BAX4_MAUEX|nr:hypothetical protein C6P45_001797 [Kazachstania exigua]
MNSAPLKLNTMDTDLVINDISGTAVRKKRKTSSITKQMPHKRSIRNVAKRGRLKGVKKAKKKPSIKNTDDDQLYGILEKPNINYVQFGIDKKFHTWYGTNVYFENGTKELGIRIDNSVSTNEIGKKTIQPVFKDKENNNQTSENMWLDTLRICEYCFKYTDQPDRLKQHAEVCPYKDHLPGKIKYKSPQYTIRRVKGSKHKLFCQCLCLFTKLFLDNKSMYFKVDNYEFYMLYETGGNKPMGFFSKDLLSYQQNNLACILVFPPYQRRQLGTLLIEFSYCVSKRQNLITGPELPLSPFGLICYLFYWSNLIAYELLDGQLSERATVSLNELSQATGIRVEDVTTTLTHLGCLDSNNNICIGTIREWSRKQKAAKKKMIDSNGQIMLDHEYLLIDD